MALTQEFVSRLQLFGLGPECDADRKAVWDCVGAAMPQIGDKLVRTFAKRVPPLEARIDSAGPVLVESLVRCTGNSFVRPHDEAWLDECLRRVALERQNGLDIRARPAVNRAILTAFTALLARRFRFSATRLARHMDIATRVLMHDSALAAYLHYEGKMRDIGREGEELASALKAFDGATEKVGHSVSRGAEVLKETSHELESLFDAVGEDATRARQASDATADSIREAADAASRLSAAIEALERESAQSAAQAEAAARQMSDTNQTIASLSDAVQRIGSVIEVIAQVASQTNLLALNATIEAARAGDAGRGFAVVAQEVKALAKQTSGATSQIADIISAIEKTTQRAVVGIGGAGRQIDEVADISRRLAAAVHQQMAATDHISRTASATAESAVVMTTALNAVSASLERMGGTALSTRTLSGDLAGQTRLLSQAMETLVVISRKHEASTKPLDNVLAPKKVG